MTSFFLRWYANPFRIAVLSGDYLIEISVQLPFDWLIAMCLIKIWDPRKRIKSIYIIALVIYSRTSKDMDWGTDTTWPCFALNTEHQYWIVTVQYLCIVKKISMTSNVLPLHFAPSQTSSSQNSNVDSYLQYCEVDSLKQC